LIIVDDEYALHGALLIPIVIGTLLESFGLARSTSTATPHPTSPTSSASSAASLVPFLQHLLKALELLGGKALVEGLHRIEAGMGQLGFECGLLVNDVMKGAEIPAAHGLRTGLGEGLHLLAQTLVLFLQLGLAFLKERLLFLVELKLASHALTRLATAALLVLLATACVQLGCVILPARILGNSASSKCGQPEEARDENAFGCHDGSPLTPVDHDACDVGIRIRFAESSCSILKDCKGGHRE
jgi:hypothetical protein